MKQVCTMMHGQKNIKKEKRFRPGIQLSLFYIAFNVFQSALSGQVTVQNFFPCLIQRNPMKMYEEIKV